LVGFNIKTFEIIKRMPAKC